MTKLRNWAVVAVVCALMSLGYRVTADAYAGVPIVGSTGTFSDLVSTAGMLHFAGSYITEAFSGSWLAWNTASSAETDFVNNNGGGAGGFNWYDLGASGVFGSPIMTLSHGGNLTVSQVTGNAATASALSGSLSQCPGGATGIAANGDANCLASGSQLIQSVAVTSLCSTTTAAYNLCVAATVSWPSTFGASNYGINCQVVGALVAGVIATPIPSNKTTTTFQLSIQNGTGSGAVVTTPAEVDCTGTGVRP